MSPAQGGSGITHECDSGIVSSDDVCLLSLSISALKPKVRGHADAGGGCRVSCHHVRSPPRAPGPRVCSPLPWTCQLGRSTPRGGGCRAAGCRRGSRQVAQGASRCDGHADVAPLRRWSGSGSDPGALASGGRGFLPVTQGDGAGVRRVWRALPLGPALTRLPNRFPGGAKLREFKMKPLPRPHPKWTCVRVHSGRGRTPGWLG